MRLDRLHRQRELTSDLLVGVAAGNEAQHLALTGRQLVELLVDAHAGRAHGEGIQHEAGQTRREHRVAGRDPLDRVGQLGAADGLRDVPTGTGADDGNDVVGRIRDGQGEEADVRMPGQHAADDCLTATAGHVHVDQHHIGQPLADHLDRRLDLRGVADHIDVRGELRLHADPEDVMVVHEEDPYARAHGCTSGFAAATPTVVTVNSTSVPSPGVDDTTA